MVLAENEGYGRFQDPDELWCSSPVKPTEDAVATLHELPIYRTGSHHAVSAAQHNCS